MKCSSLLATQGSAILYTIIEVSICHDGIYLRVASPLHPAAGNLKI